MRASTVWAAVVVTGLVAIGLGQPQALAADRTNLGLFPVVINSPPGIPGTYTCLSMTPSGNGKPVNAQFCADNIVSAQWQVIKVQDATGGQPLLVRLRNIGYGRCVDADTSTLYPYLDGELDRFVVQMWACNDSPQQTWVITRASGSVWSFPDGVVRESRFLVKDPSGQNLPLGVVSHFRVGSSVALPSLSRAVLVKPGTGPHEQRVFGTGTADLGPNPSLHVDSPGLQCAMAGYSGTVVRTSSADPPTFQCRR